MNRFVVGLALASTLFVQAGHCAEATASQVLLSIKGKIAVTNSKDKKSYEFSSDEFYKIKTTTIQAENGYVKKEDFTGPLVRDLLAKVQVAQGAKEVIATGLDGYAVRIPLNDFTKWDVVAAHSFGGKRMTVDTKGPIWMMYPLNDHPAELRNTFTSGKLVWSLVTLEVR